MTQVFEDLSEELNIAKQAFEHVFKKEAPIRAEEMTDHTTFVCDWCSENLPLENKDGTALDEFVRDMVADSVYKKAAPMIKKDPPPAEDILVFCDQGGFVNKVLQHAPEGRINSKKLITKPADMMTQEDVESLLSSKKWDLVIFGYSLDEPKSNNAKDVLEKNTEVMKFALILARAAYLKEGSVKRMCVLTHNTFSEEKEDCEKRGLSLVTHGTMFGYCNTARQELEIPIQYIDCEYLDEPEMLPFIASDVFRRQTFGMNSVRHCYPWPVKDGVAVKKATGRFVYRHKTSHQYEKNNAGFELPSEGVIIIAGGNGALGLVFGHWLLEKAKKQVAESGGVYKPKISIQFASRSMKLSDLNMPLWKKCQDAAAEVDCKVEQVKADMSSQEGVDNMIKAASPNLIGFIHSAGVLYDSMIPNQSWEKFKGCFEGKHWAAMYMHDAFERIPNPNFHFFWLFTSVSAYGNMGQLNYSSSNAFLDSLARWRRATGRPCVGMHWGAWGEVGMAATMDDAMRRRVMMGPMPYFTVAQGLRGMEGGLRTGLSEFSTYLVNPPMMFGMVQGDQSENANFSRNWYSEFVPHPAPHTFDSNYTYNIYRMYRYIQNPYHWGPQIVHDKFVKPNIEQAEGEEARPEITQQFGNWDFNFDD